MNFFQFRQKLVTEGVKDLKNYKDRDRRGHEGYFFIHVIKGNSSNKYNDDFGFTQDEMNYMDKLMSKIKKMHIASFEGGEKQPASLEFYGDMSSMEKFLKDRKIQQIVKKYKGKVGGPNKL